MQENKMVEEDEPPEDFVAFDTTFDHGFQLHQEYMNTAEGQNEIAHLSLVLQDILAHYMQAAMMWFVEEESDA